MIFLCSEIGILAQTEKPIISDQLPEIQKMTYSYFEQVSNTLKGNKAMPAKQFPVEGTNFYIDKNWLAINPNQHKEAKTTAKFPFNDGMYDLVFISVGENDGQSTFQVLVNDKEVGKLFTPMSKSSFEEGFQYNDLWENIELKKDDKIIVIAKVGSKDGKKYSRGRWAGIIFSPMTKGKDVLENSKTLSTKQNVGATTTISGQAQTSADNSSTKPEIESKDGKGKITISGEKNNGIK